MLQRNVNKNKILFVYINKKTLKTDLAVNILEHNLFFNQNHILFIKFY